MTLLAREDRAQRPRTGALSSWGVRLTRVMDLATLSALALFAAWTVFYLLALSGVLPSGMAFWAWVLSAPVVVFLVLRHLRPLLESVPAGAPWIPLALCALFGTLALLIIRPDLDDAAYVVRSTWIAANGDMRVGDVIFSDGAWPGLPVQTPYLASIEALFGWLARTSGLHPGSVVYVLYPPVASALAVWALWMLLRSWRAHRAALCLVLAAVYLLWGGAAHGSWGNLHLARIWQGKITFLAVVVPLLYALTAAFWTAQDRTQRRAALVAVGLVGVAGVGLTPAAVFVVPGVLLAALTPGLLQRRWGDAVRLFAVGAAPSGVAGVVVLAMGRTTDGGIVARAAGEDPWEKVLGTGVPAAIVILAAVLLALSALWPHRWASCAPVGSRSALAAVAFGLLVAVPALYEAASAVMGTDAIAWRLTWLVPVPALVGLLAGLPRWSGPWPGVPLAVAAGITLVWSGLPLWSTANGAAIAATGAWKIAPSDLTAARWVADVDPAGRVLAPVGVSAALGIVTSEVAPVGSRDAYMEAYEDQPGAQMDERLLLQRLADSGSDPADLEQASAALTALDVQVVCSVPWHLGLHEILADTGYDRGFSSAELVCFERTRTR